MNGLVFHLEKYTILCFHFTLWNKIIFMTKTNWTSSIYNVCHSLVWSSLEILEWFSKHYMLHRFFSRFPLRTGLHSSGKAAEAFHKSHWHQMSQLMRLWYLSHRRPAKAQASLRNCAVSPEPSLFAHMKYGSRRRVRPKIRHLAPLDGCTCVFEEWVYGGRKVP